ncbi:MAG: FecR domain-containing protein [Candidatus Eiseniibacteriota bacterium]
MTRPGAGVELAALQIALRRMPRRAAPPEFHALLRTRFVRDEIPARAPRERAIRRRLAVGAVAAVCGIAATLLLVAGPLNLGAAWKLSAVTGTGTAIIDGHPVPLGAPDALANRLHSGAEVVLPPEAQLDLELPGLALMQITGGTRATVPGRPGRWFGRSVTTSLTAGELRISTGPAFAGTRLTVVTPQARAVVAGTTLAVLCNRDTSCVCVFEGRVAMIGGVSDTVQAGFRRTVFLHSRPPLLEPIRPMEAMKLGMLREAAHRTLGR